MIYFGRHPSQYHSTLDYKMISQIEVTFSEAVKTPDFKHYTNMAKMFDVLYECEAGVFRPYEGYRFDQVTFSHVAVMFALKRPVYVVHNDLSITRLHLKTDTTS